MILLECHWAPVFNVQFNYSFGFENSEDFFSFLNVILIEMLVLFIHFFNFTGLFYAYF